MTAGDHEISLVVAELNEAAAGQRDAFDHIATALDRLCRDIVCGSTRLAISDDSRDRLAEIARQVEQALRPHLQAPVLDIIADGFAGLVELAPLLPLPPIEEPLDDDAADALHRVDLLRHSAHVFRPRDVIAARREVRRNAVVNQIKASALEPTQ